MDRGDCSGSDRGVWAWALGGWRLSGLRASGVWGFGAWVLESPSQAPKKKEELQEPLIQAS